MVVVVVMIVMRMRMQRTSGGKYSGEEVVKDPLKMRMSTVMRRGHLSF